MYFKVSVCGIGANRPPRAGNFIQKSTKKQNRTSDSMCVCIESSSVVAAGFGTLKNQVAGFHRAVPSTTLDKACMQFVYILSIFPGKSSFFCKIIYNSFMDIFGK